MKMFKALTNKSGEDIEVLVFPESVMSFEDGRAYLLTVNVGKYPVSRGRMEFIDCSHLSLNDQQIQQLEVKNAA